MRISVIVTSYNHERYLKQAIDSVLDQTLPADQVIVIDDASSDGSPAIIASYGSRVTAMFKANGGHTSAVNHAFEAATGDIVCFLDSDDFYAPHKLEVIAKAWQQNPEAEMLYHQLQSVDAVGRPMGKPWPQRLPQGDISARIRDTSGWWPRPTTSGLCFKREFLAQLWPLPTGIRVWPDTYLASSAALTGTVIGVRQALACYRVHSANTITLMFPAPKTEAEKQQLNRSRVEQFNMELNLIRQSMQKLSIQGSPLTLRQHPSYLAAMRASGGDVSLWRVLRAILCCPAVPLLSRPRLLFDVLLRSA